MGQPSHSEHGTNSMVLSANVQQVGLAWKKWISTLWTMRVECVLEIALMHFPLPGWATWSRNGCHRSMRESFCMKWPTDWWHKPQAHSENSSTWLNIQRIANLCVYVRCRLDPVRIASTILIQVWIPIGNRCDTMAKNQNDSGGIPIGQYYNGRARDYHTYQSSRNRSRSMIDGTGAGNCSTSRNDHMNFPMR